MPRLLLHIDSSNYLTPRLSDSGVLPLTSAKKTFSRRICSKIGSLSKNGRDQPYQTSVRVMLPPAHRLRTLYACDDPKRLIGPIFVAFRDTEESLQLRLLSSSKDIVRRLVMLCSGRNEIEKTVYPLGQKHRAPRGSCTILSKTGGLFGGGKR